VQKDTFFSQSSCDRCGGSLDGGRTMSKFSTECICILCSEIERQDPEYNKAVRADHEQIKLGNYNFEGIRNSKK
jgi:hypothetical protein